MQTFWLYYAGAPLTAVILPEGSTPEEVRAKAIAWHWKAPCVSAAYPEHSPFMIEHFMRHAEVRILPPAGSLCH